MTKARIGTTEKIQVGVTDFGKAGIVTPKTSLREAGHKILATAVQATTAVIALAIDWAREQATEAVTYTRGALDLDGCRIQQVVALDGCYFISGQAGTLQQAVGKAFATVLGGFMRLFGQMAGVPQPTTGEMYFGNVGGPLDLIDGLIATTLDGPVTSLHAVGFLNPVYSAHLDAIVAERKGYNGYFVLPHAKIAEAATRGFVVECWTRTNELDAQPLGFPYRTDAANLSAVPISTRLGEGMVGCDTIDATLIMAGQIRSIADAAVRRATVQKPVLVLGATANGQQTVLAIGDELHFVPERRFATAVRQAQAAI